MCCHVFFFSTTARVGARSLALAVCLVQGGFFLRAPFVVTPMVPGVAVTRTHTRLAPAPRARPGGKDINFFRERQGSDFLRGMVWMGYHRATHL